MADIFILIIRGIELLLRTMGKDLGERGFGEKGENFFLYVLSLSVP